MNTDLQLVDFLQWVFDRPATDRRRVEDYVLKLSPEKKEKMIQVAVETKKQAVRDYKKALKTAAEAKSKPGEMKKLEELLNGM